MSLVTEPSSVNEQKQQQGSGAVPSTQGVLVSYRFFSQQIQHCVLAHWFGKMATGCMLTL